MGERSPCPGASMVCGTHYARRQIRTPLPGSRVCSVSRNQVEVWLFLPILCLQKPRREQPGALPCQRASTDYRRRAR